jgi:hypothetical protein
VSDRRLEALIQEREAEVPVPPFPAHRRKPEAKSGSLRLAVQPMPWQRAAYLEAGRQGGVGLETRRRRAAIPAVVVRYEFRGPAR